MRKPADPDPKRQRIFDLLERYRQTPQGEAGRRRTLLRLLIRLVGELLPRGPEPQAPAPGDGASIGLDQVLHGALRRQALANLASRTAGWPPPGVRTDLFCS